MHSDNYETLIHKHLSNELSSSEREAFETWLAASEDNRRRLEEAERIWTLAAEAEPTFDIDLDAEMHRFKSRVGYGQPSAKITPLYTNRLLQLAAAAVILLGGVLLVLRLGGESGAASTIIETVAGEVREITLPDQSTVWLNEESKLTYLTAFDQRTVSLEGEAFFDVTHDPNNRFEIESDEGLVQVLGTSFSVRNRIEDDEITVVVATGTVALIHPTSSSTERLEAGYKGTLDKQSGTLTSFPNNDPGVFSWQAKPLSFENTSVRDVVVQLRSHFGIVIAEPTPALASCTFTGGFDAPNLEEIVDALSFSLDVEVALNAGVYALTGTGCNP